MDVMQRREFQTPSAWRNPGAGNVSFTVELKPGALKWHQPEDVHFERRVVVSAANCFFMVKKDEDAKCSDLS